MSIIEIQSKIFEVLKKQDIFELDADWKKIFLISEDEARDKELVRLALDHLQYVKKFTVEKRTFWVLDRPLSQYNQTIELTAETIFAIGDIINSLERPEFKTDITNLKEIDIKNLCLLIYAMQAQNETKEE